MVGPLNRLLLLDNLDGVGQNFRLESRMCILDSQSKPRLPFLGDYLKFCVFD